MSKLYTFLIIRLVSAITPDTTDTCWCIFAHANVRTLLTRRSAHRTKKVRSIRGHCTPNRAMPPLALCVGCARAQNTYQLCWTWMCTRALCQRHYAPLRLNGALARTHTNHPKNTGLLACCTCRLGHCFASVRANYVWACDPIMWLE